MKKTLYQSPAELARAMTERHAATCTECHGDELCRWHSGYREGITTLLLKASAG